MDGGDGDRIPSGPAGSRMTLPYGVRDETGTPGIDGFLEARLLEDLAGENRQAVNSRITLAFRNGGRIVGGLDGSTSYGWLLVKVIWISKDCRRQGFGRRLLSRAAAIARSRKCHSVWLDTSSPTALDFYRALGFELFGVLSNRDAGEPAEHHRWFLHRRLDGL